jgi:hypothetical protein
MADGDATMTRPRFKNELNITTLVTLFGFFAAIFAGGIAWQTQKSASETNATAIQQLRTDVTGLQSDNRAMGNLRFRVDMLESGASNSAAAVRDLEVSVNELKTDVRVVREILERMDTTGSRRTR